MNSVTLNNMTTTLTKDVDKFLSSNGKYACAVLAIYMLHDIVIRAMDKGYPVSFNVDDSGMSFKIGQKIATE